MEKPRTDLATLLRTGAHAAGARACVLYRVQSDRQGHTLTPLMAAGEGALALRGAILRLHEADVALGKGRRAQQVPGDHGLWQHQPPEAAAQGAVFARLEVSPKEPLALGYFAARNAAGFDEQAVEATRDLLEAALGRSSGAFAAAGPEDAAERLARREADAKVEAEFLAGLGHELKTPLNAIIGFSSLLEKQIRDEELLEEVEMISLSAEKLLVLIDDLIDTYKVQAGKLVLHRDLSNINEVIANAAETVRVIADERNIRVRTFLDNEIRDFRFDAKRLQQVMNNLLGNAIKFVPGGGEIIIRSNDSPSGARVQVADTGEGIPPEVLPEIFERYKQAKGSEARDARSAGLGLALCRDFVEMHGGEITVTSEPKKGSIFTFTIPYEAPEGENSEN